MTTTVSITHGDLSRLVRIVGPSVGTDALLPVFTQVRFRGHGGRVEAVATDRHTVAAARGEASWPDGLEFGLLLSDLRHLLGVTKPRRVVKKLTSPVALSMTIDKDKVHVTTTQGMLAAGSDVAVTYEVPKGDYPKIDHLLTALPEPVPGATYGFNPEYIRRLPVGEPGEPVVQRATGPGKPIGFYGRGWLVLIVAARLSVEQAELPDEWASPRPPAQKSEAAA